MKKQQIMLRGLSLFCEVQRLIRCHNGSTVTEYALIASIISIIAISSIIAIGGSVNQFFTNAANGFR